MRGSQIEVENASFDWQIKRLYNSMENMKSSTQLYAIAYVIVNSIDNLEFDKDYDKECYFNVL